MILQKVIIPDNNRGYPTAYARGGKTDNCSILLASGETVSFDTYFNAFCFPKYRTYTRTNCISVTLRFSGSVRMSLCVYDGSNKTICCTSNGCDGILTLEAVLSELPENGILYPEITALSDSRIISIDYTSECKADTINACISFCTFRREPFILHNIEILRRHKFSFINKVFVVDNGNTLDTTSLNDETICVLPNKNLGGSGGFTRGLIEAKDNKYTHIILMDDDVEFHPETLEQMTIFASILKTEYRSSWFSAAMLPLNKPFCQYELGAEWDGVGAIVHKHNIDITDPSALVDNLINPNVGYGGWWTLLMPITVTDNGLPYPFFIKFDDVEYGLRKNNDTEIITMNGIAVRHEAFDTKKSFLLDYYNLRNELFMNTIHGKCNAIGAAKRFLREAMKNMVLYRYDAFPLAFRAVNDFLGGAELLINADAEQLNNELITMQPKLIPLKDMDCWEETLRRDEHIQNKHITIAMLLTLGGHLIPSFLLKKEMSAVPLSRAGAVDFFGRKAVIQYQLGGDNGILTKRSFAEFAKYGFRSIACAVKLMVGFSKVRTSLLMRKEEITSFQLWRDKLGI